MRAALQANWYGPGGFLTLVLLPVSWLFCAVVRLRRLAYRLRLPSRGRLPVPVVVIGNLTVGGTGKTPLVIWTAEFLKQHGYTPGIVSRGYGGRAKRWPQQVRGDSDPSVVGDEAVLIAGRTGCPMAVGPDRVAAARALLAHSDCDVILSDDGLQHYALRRDVEIAVIDGMRRFGNRRCLPAGPLREPLSRLASVDLLVSNGAAAAREYAMRYRGRQLRRLLDGEECELKSFDRRSVHAVAGIGNPEAFFVRLTQAGLRVIPHAFADHHAYRPEDLAFEDEKPVIMTEKDAVKCRRFAAPQHWYLPVAAELDPAFGKALLQRLKRSENG